MSNIDQLNERFGIRGVAAVRAGQGGLPCIEVTSDLAAARVYLLGAHVTDFQPRGREHKPVLWMSRESAFAEGKPIRGGVPICFPWFGGKADDPKAPGHGIVRTRSWEIDAIHQRDDGSVEIVLGLQVPGEFDITHTVVVGRTLSMSLVAGHLGAQPAKYEMALHTYFTVGDVRKVHLGGLNGVTYVDKVDKFTRKTQAGDVTFAGETDRVYLDTAGAVTLHDPSMNRRITVDKRGSQTTVVWNPWTEKAARMADFGDDEWPTMVCIETANAADNALTLKPGASHTMTAMISVDAG